MVGSSKAISDYVRKILGLSTSTLPPYARSLGDNSKQKAPYVRRHGSRV